MKDCTLIVRYKKTDYSLTIRVLFILLITIGEYNSGQQSFDGIIIGNNKKIILKLR